MTNENEKKRGEELLQTICGARLSSVQFVLDYLILGFDEKGALTALVWPEIASRGLILKFGEVGYRDSLCSLIMQVVEYVDVSGDETITIRFRDGSLAALKLQSSSDMRERAIFTGPNNVLFAW